MDSFCGAGVWGEDNDEILNLVWDFSGGEMGIFHRSCHETIGIAGWGT